jgi:hypothetical protein
MLGIVLVGLPKRTPIGMSFGSSFAQENARKAIAMHAACLKTPTIPIEFFKTVLLARHGLRVVRQKGILVGCRRVVKP